MNKQTRKRVAEEANRYLEREKELAMLEADDKADMQKRGRRFPQSFPREQGALRRASMDLTRALADLRRPS